MKYLIYAVFLFMILTSCRKAGTEDYFYPNEPEVYIQKSVSFGAVIDSSEMDSDMDLQAVFSQKAGEECFRLGARKIMQQQPLLRGSYARYDDFINGMYNFRGKVDPDDARHSGELMQDYSCTILLQPYYSLAGEIISLDEERTIGAGNDKITIALFDLLPEKLPAYFMIGRGVKKNNQDLMSVYGSGRIIQVLGDISDPASHMAADSVLAHGVILETNHEVRRNDLIFLVSMDVKAIEEEVQEIAPREASTFTDEVRVRPEVRKTESEPQEMK